MFLVMARTFRAFPLAVALGAALALPVSAPAADGGAAPEPTAPGAASPGSAAQAPPAPAPVKRGTAKKSGGAAPGTKPPAQKGAKPKAKKRKQPARRSPAKRPPAKSPPPPSAPTTPVTPVTPDPVVPTPGAGAETVAGIFPVQGSHTFGGEGSRFGAGRPGHIHQGQDVAADEGTPLVAPLAGTVTWKANQPGGAGIYLVLRGSADGRDYVFMHLKSGSVLVEAGTIVTAGQQLAQVGSTGVSSGPHLHFEIWVGGWQARGGAPIDPLPQLQRWAAGPG